MTNVYSSVLLLLALISVCLLVGATLLTDSTEEALADRSPPRLPTPTAAVELLTLTSTVTGMCADTERFSLFAPEPPDGERLVVTSVSDDPPSPLDPVTVLGAVSNRPLFYVATAVPFFRDIGVGTSGPDVEHLENALAATGRLSQSEVDERFTDDTLQALNQLLVDNRLNTTEQFYHQWTVTSPDGGTIASYPIALGQVLQPGDLLVGIANGDRAVTCEIAQVAELSAGDKVMLEAGADQIEATVVSVTPSTEREQWVNVAVAPVEPLDEAATALTITVELASTNDEVTSVPIGALFPSASGGYELHLVDNDQDDSTASVSKPVKVGPVIGGMAQVTAVGLEVGQLVELNLAVDQSPTLSDQGG